jgi:hypothetical protein
MPSVQKNEKQDHYMHRCVPVLIKEGKKQNQAVAQCLSMYKQHWKRKKSKASINGKIEEPDWEKDNETKMFVIKGPL